MPSFAETLKAEILRLARKEVKREVAQLRKQVASHRTALAALRRQLAEVERQGKRRARAAVAKPASAKKTSARFSPKGLKSFREKLGLSAASVGQLLAVSGQTVYNWEVGKGRPKPEQLMALQALRGMGKRAVMAKLEEANG